MFCYGSGIGPIGWTVVAELSPAATKGFCTSVAISLRYLSVALQNQYFPDLIDATADWPPFIFFFVLLLFGALFYHLVVPETKDLSPEQLEKVFDSPSPANSQSTLDTSIEEKKNVDEQFQIAETAIQILA